MAHPRGQRLHCSARSVGDGAQVDPRQVAADLAGVPFLTDLLAGFSTPAALIDGGRRLVAVNDRALALFEIDSPFDAYGVEIGRALACATMHEALNACGTHPRCSACGLQSAIAVAADRGTQTGRECRVTVVRDGRERSFDLLVQATPLLLAGHSLFLVAVEDIAHQKRREALERIFFHDVLAAATGLHGLARLAGTPDGPSGQQLFDALIRCSGQVLDEIQAQRDLMLAERGELRVTCAPVSINDLLDDLRHQYRLSALADGRSLDLQPLAEDRSLNTDRTLLLRSLANLVRNALEAAAEGGRVVVSAESAPHAVLFHVTNEGHMPATVQAQVFERSFSTKREGGHGLGTYSVKLIVERYLQGRVWFVSAPDTGTVFTVSVPWLRGDD